MSGSPPTNTPSTMKQYQYSPLDGEEIRLVHILPGQFDDPIRIAIVHARLPPAPAAGANSQGRRLLLRGIRDALPRGWRAYETVDGRVIYRNRHSKNTRWIHPDPNFRDTNASTSVPTDDDNGILGHGPPDYEALSYVWGSSSCSATAIVENYTTPLHSVPVIGQQPQDGFLPQTNNQVGLRIRKNLAEAIRYLRLIDRPRVLWIDAICVDQENKPERNKQVPRMADIFKSASRVVAWLGPESENSRLAMLSCKWQFFVLFHIPHMRLDDPSLLFFYCRLFQTFMGKVKIGHRDGKIRCLLILVSTVERLGGQIVHGLDGYVYQQPGCTEVKVCSTSMPYSSPGTDS